MEVEVKENHMSKLVDTVAETIIESFKNLTVEDVDMWKVGYDKAIDDVLKELNDIDFEGGTKETIATARATLNYIIGEVSELKRGDKNDN